MIESINNEDKNGDHGLITNSADVVDYDKLLSRSYMLPPIQRCYEETETFILVTLCANPVMLHVICVVVVMQMASCFGRFCLINNPTPGTNPASVKEETE